MASTIDTNVSLKAHTSRVFPPGLTYDVRAIGSRGGGPVWAFANGDAPVQIDTEPTVIEAAGELALFAATNSAAVAVRVV